MRNKLTILLLFVVTTIGCKSGTSAPEENKVILPLAIGNTWQYQTTSYDSNKKVTDVRTDTTLIQDTSQINGEIFYFSRANIFSRTGYKNESDGLWVHKEGEAMAPYTILFIPYPISVNTVEWQSMPFVSSIVLLNTDTVITVPAGSFHTLQYRHDYLVDSSGHTVYRDILYYGLNVGLIYAERNTISSDEQFHLRAVNALIKYSLY
jgi:hypothetical protein